MPTTIFFRRNPHECEELCQTLHLLILKTLARNQQMHGYEIAAQSSSFARRLQVEEGSLYPRATSAC